MRNFISFVYSFFFNEKPQPSVVTDVQQAKDADPLKSSSASSVNGTDDLADIQSENVKLDTQWTEPIQPTAITSHHIDDLDKKNIYVNCAGKTDEFFIFPSEKISVLHQEACERLYQGRRPENMGLIFKGEYLDLSKTAGEYPRLRSGSEVKLIHAC